MDELTAHCGSCFWFLSAVRRSGRRMPEQGNEWNVKSFSQNMEYILNVRSFFVLLIKWFWLSHALQYPHHGNRSFAVALDDILPYSPSRRQILHVRSGWRLTFPSLWRSFIQLSFWTGVRMPYEKNENGIVARSEESIMLVTSYRLPHRGYRFFTFVQDGALPSHTGIMELSVRRSSLAHVVRLRILARRNDSNRKRIVSL